MNIQKAQKELSSIMNNSGGDFRDFVPYLLPKELSLNKTYRFRILPPHPEKNPDGYVYIPRCEIHADRPVNGFYKNSPTSKVATLHRDGFQDKDAPMNFLEHFIMKAVNYFANYGPPEVNHFDRDEDLKLFWRSFNAASTPSWKTWEYPIILWATCSVSEQGRDGGKGKKVYSNYQPSNKNDDALPRILQFSQVDLQADIIQLETMCRTPLNEDDDRDLSGYELNSPTLGFDLTISKVPDGKRDYPRYEVNFYSGRKDACPLNKKLLEAYGPDSPNYPNLVDKLKRVVLPDDKLREAVENSWWGKHIMNYPGFEL
jgi:hypothetical protein